MRHHSQIDYDLDDKICLRYQVGYSTIQISEEFGIDRKHVRRALRRTGTALRSHAEAIEMRRAMG